MVQIPIEQADGEFFDLQSAPIERVARAKSAFARAATSALEAAGAEPLAANALTSELWERMADPRLHYHTPVHVLCIFAAARRLDVALSAGEALALLFHDAVYDPQSEPGRNEECSAELLLRSLPAAGVAHGTCARAADAIRCTARYAEAEVPAEHALVMDLDLAGLASDSQSFQRQSDALRTEMSHLAPRDYERASLALLRSFLARPRIYRGSALRSLEAAARANVALEVRRLEERARGKP